jgi:hypothetical protein
MKNIGDGIVHNMLMKKNQKNIADKKTPTDEILTGSPERTEEEAPYDNTLDDESVSGEESSENKSSFRDLGKISIFALFIIGLIIPFSSAIKAGAASQPETNLIANANLETEMVVPAVWNRGGFGENAALFSYPDTGIGGSRSVRVDMTAYENGDAKWYFDDVPIKPSTKYTFSDSSSSNVPTSIDIRYKVASKNPITGQRFKYRYVKLGDVPAQNSTTMKQFTFTTPANAVSLTIFHYIDRIGYLVTDNYSLMESGVISTTTPDASAPLVSITAPTTGATVSGTVTISVNASDNVGVSGVSMVHSGTNHSDILIGTEDTIAPYSFEWNTAGVANGVHMLQAKARDAAGNIGTSTMISVTVNNTASSTDTTAPTVSITAPTNGATVSGTTTVSVISADNVGVVSNNLFIDGVSTASLGTSSPVAFIWNTAPLAGGVYTLYAVAKDALGNTATSSAVSVTVQNETADDTMAPVVSITSPINGAMVYGTTTVSVNASDTIGIEGVRLLLDGTVVGTEDTVSPYNFDWNTVGVANGTHILTSRARDAAGNTATSSAISVTVSN